MPLLWKSAYIAPIHKKGSRDLIVNYRPISKLCLLAKILERIVKNQLITAIQHNFDDSQHGFLSNRSTVSNLSLFNDIVTCGMTNSRQVDAIYTDYAKAFDRIDHKLLISKLYDIGVGGRVINWFCSYIHGRCQAVTVNGYTSSWINVPSGVPQGSLLGPILFLIFINDLKSCFRYSKYLLFADDMKIVKEIRDYSDALLLQEDLTSFAYYCETNNLDLNINKCNFITFSRRHDLVDYTYSVNGQSLERVSAIRDLGVIHDDKLLFDQHIANVVSKAKRSLGFLIRVSKPFKSMKTVKILYCSLVRSCLEYASQIWNPQYEIYISDLEKVQKKFTRYLGYKFKTLRLPYRDRCRKFHFLTLQQRRDVTDLVFLCKLVRGSVDCPELLRRVQFKIPKRIQRQQELFLIESYKTNYRKNSFMVRACNSYNKLLKSIPELDIFSGSIQSFKNRIIKHFNS